MSAASVECDAGREVFRKVVNVSSLSGLAGAVGSANYYAAGKAGLVGLTKALAKEWGQYKVNVNAVAFGFIDTRLTAPPTPDSTITIDGATEILGLDPSVHAALAATIPLGRAGTVREAAGGIFVLCTPWTNFVHGQVLTVSGG
jgi:3-oxoacyl-[acyl-carrier protein] reductase